MLRIGTGRRDITPPIGIAHTRWGARTRETADSIHRPLFASALALDGGSGLHFVIELDATNLPTPECDELRRDIGAVHGIAVERISLSCTHTHSSPVWDAEFRNGGLAGLPGMHLLPAYRDYARAGIKAAAAEAIASLQPAVCAAGYAPCEVTFNRRLRAPDGRVVVAKNADGPRDPVIGLVRFDTPAGEPLATILSYGTHPIVLAHQNSAISPDYVGATRAVYESVVGGFCLFLQGCAGDQIPVEALTGDLGAAERVGRRIAADAAAVALTLETRPFTEEFAGIVESGAPLGLWEKRFAPPAPASVVSLTEHVGLPVRRFPPIETLQQAAADARDAVLALDRTRCTAQEIAAAAFRAKRTDTMVRIALGALGKESAALEIQALRIGDAVLVFAPVELFALTGRSIREASPFAVTIVCGYTNGMEGYLPRRQDFLVGGYEVDLSTYFSEDAEEMLRAAIIAMLGKLHATSPFAAQDVSDATIPTV